MCVARGAPLPVGCVWGCADGARCARPLPRRRCTRGACATAVPDDVRGGQEQGGHRLQLRAARAPAGACLRRVHAGALLAAPRPRPAPAPRAPPLRRSATRAPPAARRPAPAQPPAACALGLNLFCAPLTRRAAGAGDVPVLPGAVAAGRRAPPAAGHRVRRRVDRGPPQLGALLRGRGGLRALQLLLEPLHLVQPHRQLRRRALLRRRGSRSLLSGARVH